MVSCFRCRKAANLQPRSTRVLLALAALSTVALAGLTSCASPGPPRSPSLNLPGPVKDLAATRQGTTVVLRFTLPQRSTDHLPLRAPTVAATLCRAVDTAVCVPLAALTAHSFPRITDNRATIATVTDPLPSVLTTGAPHSLSYRVELFNPAGQTAGFSDPAYTVAGAAPPAVEGFTAQGSRLGIVISWRPAPADGSQVVLHREDLAPKPPHPPKPTTIPAKPRPKSSPPVANKINADDEPNAVWLSTTPSGTESSSTNMVLDATALTDEPYRYTAERRRSVQLGGRTLEMRSDASAPIPFTLHDIFPPPVPTDLTAAAFHTSNTDPSSALAVDLIWQPVDDPGLSGYNIYRQPIDATGNPTGQNQRLNPTPTPLPAFHDTIPSTAKDFHYRYSVRAIDTKGNESSACTFTLNPAQP